MYLHISTKMWIRMFKAELFVEANELSPFQRDRLSKYGISKKRTLGEVAVRGLKKYLY